MSLHKKMAHGALWSLLEKVGQSGMAFLIFVVLARLIGPEEFGLANICYVYIALTNVVVLGLVDGIVSLKLRDDKSLSTLFWTVTGLGSVLALLGVAAAKPFAMLMNQPDLEPLFYWISISSVLLATSAVPTFLALAKMDFRVYALRTLVSVFIGGVVGIVLAIKGFGAYAIVAQQITQYAVVNVVVWYGCGWFPKLTFDRISLQNLLSPGVKMSGSYFFSFLEQQVPKLIIGAFMGAASVGFYSLALRFRQVLYDILINPLSVVIYPMFSEIKDNIDEQKRILRQILMLMALVIFPSVAGGIVTAPLFIPLFFGDSWAPTIPSFQILLTTGATLTFIIVLRDVLRAHNKTEMYLHTQAGIVMATMAAIYLIAPAGMIPVSWVLVVISAISVPVFIYRVTKSTEMVLWQEFFRLWPPLVSSLIMGVSVHYAIVSMWLPQNGWLALGLAIGMGGVVYAIFCLILQFAEIKSLIASVKKLYMKKKQ